MQNITRMAGTSKAEPLHTKASVIIGKSLFDPTMKKKEECTEQQEFK